MTPIQRRSPRLANYDYASPGTYFVTLCTTAGKLTFGEVRDSNVRLNRYGSIVAQCWNDIPQHFGEVGLDLYVVMPNHLHGLVVLGDSINVPPSLLSCPSLHKVIGAFKSAATRRINALRATSGAPLWQRTFYEHVVRSDHGMERIREYIVNNPAKWELDEENPRSGL